MTMMSVDTKLLIEKIQLLPPDRLAEVDDFVDFLSLREQERSLTQRAAQVSAPACTAVWDNPDDQAALKRMIKQIIR
jgi:hypothetical protein